MGHRSRSGLAAIAASASVMALACAPGSLEGPLPPTAASITRVVVQALDDPDARFPQIRRREAIDEIASSRAFAPSGWSPVGSRPLVPLYRIEFHGPSGILASYWLGAHRHPPRFPCYTLCSGWWVAPSTASGDLDKSRFKGLSEHVSLALLPRLNLEP